MKYIILLHSSPRPWGHPTGDFVAEHQALPEEQRAQMNADFEALLGELHERGELLGGQALGDPAESRLYSWHAGEPTFRDGPYSESKEHLAGFFVIDVESRERADEIAARFAGPGETRRWRRSAADALDAGRRLSRTRPGLCGRLRQRYRPRGSRCPLLRA